MRPVILFLAIVVTVASAKAPLHSRTDADNVPNSYIVKLTPNLSAAKANKYYKALEATSSRNFTSSGYRGVMNTFKNMDYNAFHVKCDESTLDTLRGSPTGVESVYQDGYVYGQNVIPLDRQPVIRDDQAVSSTLWNLGRISHRDAGISNYVNEKPLRTYLYCLDTGVRVTHKEFGGRAIWRANFIANAPNTDDNGHGTHTCATAAGNTVGVDNTTTPIAVKYLDKDSSGTWSGVMTAIDWAVGDAKNRGAITRSVINMSIGGPTYQPLDDIVNNATAAGMTVVVAASNYGVDASSFSPARAAGAITVAAVDQLDARASWSNYGPSVAMFAPGENINSAWMTSDISYASMSGTSMAAPHIAGLATYLMSREAIAGPNDVKQRFLKLATKGLVKNASGSPNLIAFNGAEDSLKY